MDGEKTRLIYFDGTDYYPVLEVIVKSFVDNSPLKAIIASRARGKKNQAVGTTRGELYICRPSSEHSIHN